MPTPIPLLTAEEVYRLVEPNVAFIDSTFSSGSGVLLSNGLVLTNAHVVIHGSSLTLKFGDGEIFESVPVVGMDLLNDVALLGPIDRVGIDLSSRSTPVASEIFLVGFPGETEDLPSAAISQGIVSRLRVWEQTGLTYLQTDAAIAGGQSGGALANAQGEVIGISQSKFAESGFNLAISTGDLIDISEAISQESPSQRYPQSVLDVDGRKTSFQIELQDSFDPAVFQLEVEEDLLVHLEASSDEDVVIGLFDSLGNELVFADYDYRGTETIDITVPEPGSYTVFVGLYADTNAEVEVSSSHLLAPFFDVREAGQLAIDSAAQGTIEYWQDIDRFELQLSDGDSVEITADSSMVDLQMGLLSDGYMVDYDDDSGGGIWSLNPRIYYTAFSDETIEVLVGGLVGTGGYVVNVERSSVVANPTATPAPFPTATAAPVPPTVVPTATSASIPTPVPGNTGQELFKVNCSACHNTGTQTLVGPGLAAIGDRAASSVPGLTGREFIEQSIRHPGAFVREGFAPLMPSFTHLSEDDLTVLVNYLLNLDGLTSSTASPVPVAPVSPSTPRSTAVIAVPDVGNQNGLNQAGAPATLHHWGIAETLFLRDPDDSSRSWLASGYEIKPDLSGAKLFIQQGVQFQNGFGELTASDVAWSMNNANIVTNPNSIHDQAGHFAGLFDEWNSTGTYTIEFDFNQFDATWKDDFLNQSGRSISILSKQAFDDNGFDYVRDTVVGSGPFEIESWRRDEQVTLVSRYAGGGQHWLPALTPETDRIQLIEVNEPATRAALLATGQVDAAHLAPDDAIGFAAGGYARASTQAPVQLGVFFSGNLWEDVDARDGNPLPPKAPFVHDLPWIGSPDKHGENDMDQARLVRRALAVAIDRQQINEFLMGGIGEVVHVTYFSTSDPNWNNQWEYPYDPQESIDLLTNHVEADYQQGSADRSTSLLGGNAFEVSVYAGPEMGGGVGITGEVADAVAGYWSQLGLQTFTLKFSYQTFRPSVVGRTNSFPWITSCELGRESIPWHFPKGLVQTTLTRGGFSCGFESPEILDFYRRMATATDITDATRAANEYLDYVYYWNLQPGLVAIPDDFYLNPFSVAEWPMPPSSSSNIDGLWDLRMN